MYKNLKAIINKTLFVLILLSAYSYADNIKLVKNSIMSFDKSITVGQAFDNWENCKNKEWTNLKTNNQKQIVKFTCKINKWDCNIQWLINLDETTKVIYAKLITEGKDGELLEKIIPPLQLFRAIYANE